MRSIVVALLMFAASLVGTAKAVPYDGPVGAAKAVPYDGPVGTAKAVPYDVPYDVPVGAAKAVPYDGPVGTAKAVPYDVPYDVPVGTAKAVANGIGIHEKFKIVGTIAKLHEAQIDVKAVDGATYEIDMDDTTPVTRKMKKVPHGELKPGLRVVVLALGHDMFDLEAFEIQLVD